MRFNDLVKLILAEDKGKNQLDAARIAKSLKALKIAYRQSPSRRGDFVVGLIKYISGR